MKVIKSGNKFGHSKAHKPRPPPWFPLSCAPPFDEHFTYYSTILFFFSGRKKVIN